MEKPDLPGQAKIEARPQLKCLMILPFLPVLCFHEPRTIVAANGLEHCIAEPKEAE